MTSKQTARKTYRCTWQLDAGSPEEHKLIGVEDLDGLYRCVRALTGCEVDNLHLFEAHHVLSNGSVEVVRGNSATPREPSKILPVIIPKAGAVTAALAKLDKEFSEVSLPTFPFKLMAA